VDALPELIRSAQIAIARADDLATLDQERVHYLGKKGALTERLKELGRLPPEQRREVGQAINEAKQVLETAIAANGHRRPQGGAGSGGAERALGR